jgi:sugar transferase (PEP-CTERM/EpsH1 system associated)
VGNGVDTDYFAPVPQPAAESGSPSLVFTGTMDYRPNVEGACWFVREVWPRLKQAVPDLRFSIVGRDPAAAVRKLAEVSGITVTGSVPDVRPYLAGATVAVAPLQIARGIQNKVLEAMAMGRAVVGSPDAIEGLDVVVGQDVLMAKTVEQWCQVVSQVLSDGRLRQDLAISARARVLKDYAWEARMAPLVSLCEELSSGLASGAAGSRRAGAGPPHASDNGLLSTAGVVRP